VFPLGLSDLAPKQKRNTRRKLVGDAASKEEKKVGMSER
jgi:hypothetical protein